MTTDRSMVYFYLGRIRILVDDLGKAIDQLMEVTYKAKEEGDS